MNLPRFIRRRATSIFSKPCPNLQKPDNNNQPYFRHCTRTLPISNLAFDPSLLALTPISQGVGNTGISVNVIQSQGKKEQQSP